MARNCRTETLDDEDDGEPPFERIVAMVLDGATDGTAFRAYVQTGSRADIDTRRHYWDGRACAQSRSVQQAIEVAGCQLLYLPPYSADFCRIDKPSELKVLL